MVELWPTLSLEWFQKNECSEDGVCSEMLSMVRVCEISEGSEMSEGSREAQTALLQCQGSTTSLFFPPKKTELP